jgi:F420-non-reducing hydrogenase large subunit
MSKRITIDPITRLEGHGKIEIFLDNKSDVENVYFQVPELRGFEKFCEGRAAEEMPTLTQKICGVCPTAHHTASSKALDDLFGVEPPPAAKKLRELMYNAFMFEDHLLHFYFLGGA